ncbi:MAG: hypothetical protein GQ570_13420 [Helicobacteraceae bacterium]|nr:hypothetical protein [Helicobacteraceae bacterium]
MSLEITHIYSYGQLNKISIKNKNAVLLYGKSLDNRSDEVFTYYSKSIEDKYKIIYEENNFQLIIDDQNKFKNHLFGREFINTLSFQNYYIDATSLGFAEILLILHNLNEVRTNINIVIIYAEPKEYKKEKKTPFGDSFDLTKVAGNFKKIPPYSLLIDSNTSSKAILIPFLGFENNRLGRIMESDDGARYEQYIPILGLPAFNPSWENISLQRHHQELKDITDIKFSPASNPYETYQVLDDIYKNSVDPTLVLAPIGTKPHAIGAIIFLINKKEVGVDIGLTYDFPKKKENRTDGIGNIYEYFISHYEGK